MRKEHAELRALLKPQADATHLRDQTISPPQVTFLTGTRRDTRKLVSSWAESELVWNSHICWVTGAAGAGKSTIAQVVAETFEQKKKLAGSYFWSSTTDERSDALRLVMTLAYELATYIPKTAPHIRAVLSREPDLLNTNISLSTQLDKLVLNPCKAVFQKSSIMRSLGALKGPFVFVLDGIDKCHDVPRTIDLLDCIIGFFGQNPTIPIRFLITGRIPGSLALCAVRQEVFQIDLSNFAPKEDVADFIMASLAQCPVNPPSAADIESLTTLSNGSFSVAAPLVQFILSTSLPLTNTRLDPFYSRVLAEAGDLPYFMDILSALTLLKTPMSISGLAGLLELPYHALAKVLNQLSGIVNVPPWDDKPISFITTDVREFLLDQSRSHSFHVQLSFLRSVAFTSLDKIIAHLDRLSEDQWMLPLKGPVSIAVTEWAKHLELVREADPSFDMSGFDARWIWILSRFQVLPHFPSIIAMLALAQEPLQVSDLCTVLNIGIPDISLLLYALGPLMWRITKSPKTINLGDRVRFRHQAIIDFLIDKSRAQGLAVDPCQYTYIGQRYMDIVFGLHSSSNNKSFVVNWPRILALAVREDGDFERVFVEEAFNPVTREQRAYLDSAQSWNDARTITLEAAEMELLRSNIQGAIQSVEQTLPGALSNAEETYMRVQEGEGGKSVVLASRKIVAVVDILIGFRMLLEHAAGESARLCLQRGCGTGIQIERYPRTAGGSRLYFSVYQCCREANTLQQGAGASRPEVSHVASSRATPAANATPSESNMFRHLPISTGLENNPLLSGLGTPSSHSVQSETLDIPAARSSRLPEDFPPPSASNPPPEEKISKLWLVAALL